MTHPTHNGRNGNGNRNGNGATRYEARDPDARFSHDGPLRIAQVAPLYESVPPTHYGGTERIVSYLTEELVDLGHEVTLFASGDSVTSARLVPIGTRALRHSESCHDPLAAHLLLLERVLQEADRFDLIHFHCDYLHFPLSRRLDVPSLTTLHGRLDLPDLVPVYREFSEIPLVSISDAQRAPLPWANWQGTVPHGLPVDFGKLSKGRGGYLAFLGRVSPEKGLDRAIEIAAKAGIPLKIAAKIDRNDRNYYATVIRPMLRRKGVEFLGEIGEADKPKFLGDAFALLFPIDWPEPFGLVMIEALACGTPVIAFPRGSVPEIIEHGVTGYIVDTAEQAVRAVGRVSHLSRTVCRATFEARFGVPRMASDYVAIYRDRIRSPRAVMPRALAPSYQTAAE